MKVGAPFNPYRVFQGSFAPYWLLEHRGISAGAKLCYIRLLGFAGKDARCYPSLDTLGASVGVSDRQARDYVKELERQGLIVIEQRGLRKTNVYLFVWTAELERLVNAVPDESAGPDEIENDCPPGSPPDRNNCSPLDRKYPAGPIGINSAGISSQELSSSSFGMGACSLRTRTTQNQSADVESAIASEIASELAGSISDWARERGLRRLRSDRRVGYPEEECLALWSGILEQRGIREPDEIFAVLDAAVTAATRSGEWRNWAFLTLQVQLAAERLPKLPLAPSSPTTSPCDLPEEDPTCDWALAKQKIRNRLGQIPFANWFEHTRQICKHDAQITVAVADDTSRCFLEVEYGNLVQSVLVELGIEGLELTVTQMESQTPLTGLEGISEELEHDCGGEINDQI